MAIRLGRVKWDGDDIDAINTMRKEVLAMESGYRLQMVTYQEYQEVLADISARIDALEVKYGLREICRSDASDHAVPSIGRGLPDIRRVGKREDRDTEMLARIPSE